MNFKTVWLVALHEMRNHRRLVRTHVFIWIAFALCTIYFLVVTLIHLQQASSVPMLGVISPRYIMSLLSGNFVALFCTGVLLLSFDQVKLDVDNRIHEVINSKPVSNFELLFGRLVGVVMTIAMPMIVVLFLFVVYGLISETFSLPFGEPIELWSVVSFVCFDIVPNFVLFGSLVVFLALLCKSSFVGLIVTLFVLYTLFWLNSVLPLELSAPMQTVTGSVIFASDLVPTLFTPTIVINRIALLLISIGLVCLSCCLYKRLYPTRLFDLALGSTTACLGVFLIGTLFGFQQFEREEVMQWIEVHDAHFNPSSFPDVKAIRGSITIDPGRSLSLDLKLDVSLNESQSDDFVLFSLNPGYHISHLAVAGIEVTDYEFRHGLLKIPQRHFISSTNDVEISAQGRPDQKFAYLDSIDTVSNIVGSKVRQLRHLGTESSIFRSEFMVLVPGIKWYPTSGTATNEDLWEQRERDFFTLDVEVLVPMNWLVAGPSKRETKQVDRGTSHRFQQKNPIPEFALVGSQFKSASIEVEGVAFEVLYSKEHRENFESFSQSEDSIRERVQRKLENLRDKSLDYPYDSFVLVEVPSTLRVFGGGISMDTVMCPPGMVLIRETTLPTISVQSIVDRAQSEVQDISEEDLLDSYISAVSTYLTHPMFESNVNISFYRNSLQHQINARHAGARSLNMTLEHLTNALFPFTHADFDFQLALNPNIVNFASVEPLHLLGSQLRSRYFSGSLELQMKVQSVLNAPEIWDAVESLSLIDSEQREYNDLKLRSMNFRTQRLARVLRDAIDAEDLALIVSELLNRFRGTNFDFEEFLSVFADHDVVVEELAGDLITKADLPGFLASNPTMIRLNNKELPTFETSIILQNNRPVSGPVRLSLAYQSEDQFAGAWNSLALPPILVGANQALKIVIETSNPVQHIWVDPYLSLNRSKVRVDLPRSNDLRDHETNTDISPYIKDVGEVEYLPPKNSFITIDDLDQGFSIMEHSKTGTLSNVFTKFKRSLFGENEVQLDKGLPIYQLDFLGKNIGWTRKTDPTAFGRYRRTLALSSGGDGLASAKFSVTLPQIGEWKLEYYLPEKYLLEEISFGGITSALMISNSIGTVQLEIHNDSTISTHTVNAMELSTGWHTVAQLDLTAKPVDVLISNKTSNFYESVFADAVRWTPVESKD